MGFRRWLLLCLLLLLLLPRSDVEEEQVELLVSCRDKSVKARARNTLLLLLLLLLDVVEIDVLDCAGCIVEELELLVRVMVSRLVRSECRLLDLEWYLLVEEAGSKVK